MRYTIDWTNEGHSIQPKEDGPYSFAEVREILTEYHQYHANYHQQQADKWEARTEETER